MTFIKCIPYSKCWADSHGQILLANQDKTEEGAKNSPHHTLKKLVTLT